jgi:hypothetical protein
MQIRSARCEPSDGTLKFLLVVARRGLSPSSRQKATGFGSVVGGCRFRAITRGVGARPRETIKRNQVPNMNLSRVLLAPSVRGAAVDRRAAACPARFRCVGAGRARPRRVIPPASAGGRARRQARLKASCIAREFPLHERRKLLMFCRLLPDGAEVDPARDSLVQNGCAVSSFQKYSPDKSVIFDEKTEVPATAPSLAK